MKIAVIWEADYPDQPVLVSWTVSADDLSASPFPCVDFIQINAIQVNAALALQIDDLAFKKYSDLQREQ